MDHPEIYQSSIITRTNEDRCNVCTRRYYQRPQESIETLVSSMPSRTNTTIKKVAVQYCGWTSESSTPVYVATKAETHCSHGRLSILVASRARSHHAASCQRSSLYEFLENGGYVSPVHLVALDKHGPSPLHRQS
jgi:ribonuclease HII